MKKFLLITMIALFVLFIDSCDNVEYQDSKTPILENLKHHSFEEIDKQLDFYYNLKSNADKASGPDWWEKIKKWFKDHTGTHLFPDCNGSNPCGPCPGLCFRRGNIAEHVPDNYTLSMSDRLDGIDIFYIIPISQNKAIIGFGNRMNFVKNNNFYLPDDWDFGGGIAEAFGLSYFNAKRGIYPVSYDYNTNGETVIDVEIVE